MQKGSLLFTIAYVIHGLQGIYIGPQPSIWRSAFAPIPQLAKRIPMSRSSLVMRMPNVGFIIPKFFMPRYNLPNYMMIPQPPQQKRLLGGDRYESSLLPRTDLKEEENSLSETMTLEMMRQTAPFKRMDAFGNVVVFEGRDGERVLYRPPNAKLLINSYYVPYYNRYLTANYLARLQRLRPYVNNYDYFSFNFLNGLNLYPYEDQLNFYRRKLY